MHTPTAHARDEPESPLGHRPEASPAHLARLKDRIFGGPRRSVLHYQLREVIGKGGFGRVHRAHDPKLRRDVAVKELLFSSPADLIRLEREAQALARLSHPNVVQVYDCGIADDSTYVIVMELCEGPSLAAWQVAGERSRDELLQQYLQVAQGLHAAHRAGLIHRDFKPSNAVVAKDGRARVLDFGLVKLQSLPPRGEEGSTTAEPLTPISWPTTEDARIDAAPVAAPEARACAAPSPFAPADGTPRGQTPCGSPSPGSPREGTYSGFRGTPRYAAPEQLMGRPLDARADQYSFCVALFEALYGEHPFASSTARGRSTSASGRVDPVVPARDPGRVPPWLRKLLMRGLAEDPEDRHPSFEPIIQELRAHLRPRRRWPWALAAATLTLGMMLPSLGAEAPPPCGDFSTALEGTWDDERRDAVRSALSTAEDETHAALVTDGLDHYAERWIEERAEACRQGAVARPANAKAELTPTEACLERQGEELGSIVELLTDASPSAGHLDIDDASLWQALPQDPRLCRDPKLIGPTHDDSEEVVAVQERLRMARVARIVGDYPGSAAASQGALERAEALGHPALRAASRLQLGVARSLSAEGLAAREDLRAAAIEAESQGMTMLQIEALAMLVQNEATMLDATDATAFQPGAELGALALDLALAKVEALGIPDTELEGWVHASAGQFHGAQNDYEATEHQYGLAEEIFSKARAPDDMLVAGTRILRAAAMSHLPGRAQEARDLAVAAFELRRSTIGDRHPRVARDAMILGRMYHNEPRDTEAALGYYRLAAQLFRDQGRAGTLGVGEAHTEIADLLRFQGEHEAALASLELAESALASLPPETIQGPRSRLARVSMHLGHAIEDWERMERSARDALELLEALRPDDHHRIATAAQSSLYARVKLKDYCGAFDVLQRYDPLLSRYYAEFADRVRTNLSHRFDTCTPTTKPASPQ